MEPIKNRYNKESLTRLALDLKEVYCAFQVDEFLQSTIDKAWEELELKDRITKISRKLGECLPKDYGEAIGIIDQVIVKYGTWLDGFVGFFPVFVELYGQGESQWDISMAALANYTKYASSEIAVRSFIINNEERMMSQMYLWSKSDHELIRRLSSEGCRPALPWGQALASLKKDPTPILPILEQLKADPSVHVRKSVANNLNDISKTHPELVIKLAKEWYGSNDLTDWIVKTGCRTLLKKGNREVLALFGYDDVTSAEVLDFALQRDTIVVDEQMTFTFTVFAKETTKVRLEYGVDYRKANGKSNRKIFKISEVSFKQNEMKVYTRKHSFADVSVRKHYPGIHAITLIMNGKEQGTLPFDLHA